MGTIDQPLFTVDEAAAYLKTSPATIYRLIKKGELAKVKEKGSRGWKVTVQSCDAYKASLGMSKEEMEQKIRELERKVEFLMQERGADTRAPRKLRVNEMLKKHHPQTYQN